MGQLLEEIVRRAAPASAKRCVLAGKIRIVTSPTSTASLSGTGTSHSPLSAGQRASLLIDRPSPSLDRIYQLGLWLAIFFAIFLRLPPNKLLRIPPDVSPVSIRLALLFLLSESGTVQSATHCPAPVCP